MTVSEEVILNTSVVIKDARKNHFATLRKRRLGTLFRELNKITFLWDCEPGGVMRLEGHYDIHTGDTNNKYYNTDGGQLVVCARQRQCNTLLYTSLWWQFCFLEKVLSVLWERRASSARMCMFQLNVRVLCSQKIRSSSKPPSGNTRREDPRCATRSGNHPVSTALVPHN